MKTTFIILLTFSFIFNCYSQSSENLKINSGKNNITIKSREIKNEFNDKLSLKKEYKVSAVRFSLGTGAAFRLNTDDIYFLTDFNININVFSALFFKLGIDIFNVEGLYGKIGYLVYGGPNLFLPVYKDKLDLFLGGGVALNVFTYGLYYFIKSEYNINKLYSTGLGLKYMKLSSTSRGFLLTNIYFSIKL